MNQNARQFKIKRCYVCGYLFSDKHHLYPKALFRSKDNRATILLCPNHHRYANMLQTMLQRGVDDESILEFAAEYFDARFNELVLNGLMAAYLEMEQSHNRSILDLLFGTNRKEPP